MSTTTNDLRLVILGVLTAFAIFALVVWLGFIRTSSEDASVKIVSAAIAMLGAFLAAVVSLTGVLLKHSLDQRTEARLQLETDRNEVMRREAEGRLRLEAAIRAVELLSSGPGDQSLVRREGALFALCSLSQYDLTLALLHSLLVRSEVDPATAALLLDEILRSGDDGTQERAIAMLHAQAEKFVTEADYELPDCLLENVCARTLYVREWTPMVLAKVLVARSPAEWWERKFALYGLVAALAVAFRDEREERIRRDVGAILRVVLDIFPALPSGIHVGRDAVNLEQTKTQVAGVQAKSDTAREVVLNLRRWAATT